MNIKNYLSNFYVIIFFVALLLRIIFHLYSPIDYFPDSISFLKISNIIFTPNLIEDTQAMPGYPIFLFLSNKIFSNYFALDILISSILVLVAGKLYYKIFNDEQGAKVCVFLFAIYPFNIFYSSIMLSENSYIFFNIVGFTFLYFNRNLLGFLFIIISILIRPTLDLYNIIIIIVYSAFVFKDHFKTTLKKIIIFILMYCAILSPWWLYNYERFGQFVKLTPGFGLVIYAGNNINNKTGGGNYPEDFNFDIVKGVLDPIQKDQIMKESAIKFIIENPVRFIELSTKRFIRLFNIFPNYKHFDKTIVQDENNASTIMYYKSGNFITTLMPIVSGITISGLYLFSFITLFNINREKFIKLLPLFTYFILLAGIHIVTIASIRYRFPLEFIMILLSSFSINLILNKVKKKLG